MIKIKPNIFKNIFKHLFSEEVSLHTGNLAYCTILAIIPSFIIILSLFSIFSNHFMILEHPYFYKINYILNYLELNSTSNFLIDIICINLLSSSFFSLLSYFEKLYNFKFKNYIRKKLHSLFLALLTVFIIVIRLSISFTILSNNFLSQITFLIDYIVIFLSLLFFYKLSTFQKIKDILIGSLISSIFLALFIRFFFIVIENFSNISNYYGTFTPIILSFLIIYYSCYIIHLGIIINYEIKKYSIKKFNM